MSKFVMLVGPPGSGKSSMAKTYVDQGFVHINQDLQGKEHYQVFDEAILAGKDIVVDRMNFSVVQRNRYLVPAEGHGYETEIVVLHEAYDVCLVRCLNREGHRTIHNEQDARSALHTFFTKYERVQDDEADVVTRKWPEPVVIDGYVDRPSAVLCDLDGTLFDIGHRRHFVEKKEGFKKVDWKSFFERMVDDKPNQWCLDILRGMWTKNEIVFCSGRPDDYRPHTMQSLEGCLPFANGYSLFMRRAGDYRADDLVKEIILDFEILTRFKPYFVIDDRQRVVQMWRRRGLVCLQCDDGAF